MRVTFSSADRIWNNNRHNLVSQHQLLPDCYGNITGLGSCAHLHQLLHRRSYRFSNVCVHFQTAALYSRLHEKTTFEPPAPRRALAAQAFRGCQPAAAGVGASERLMPINAENVDDVYCATHRHNLTCRQ